MRWFARLGLLALLALTFVARLHNRAEIFHDGGIYFVDGDCYSRMTRAKLVTEGQIIVRHHDFENWPQGTTPHTTAPLDWCIVSLKKVFDSWYAFTDPNDASLLHAQTLDLAGALISPIFAVLTAAWLWWWGGRMRLRYRAAAVLFFALCPILVHGTVLGRPDHQSLLILLLAVTLGAELLLTAPNVPRAPWQMVAGLGWGLAMWVSLYEPLILFVVVAGLSLWRDRRTFLHSQRWMALGSTVLIAFLVDGWRLGWPDPALRQYFPAWAATIGELGHLSLSGSLVWQWFGLFWLALPVLLWSIWREERRAVGLLILFAVTFGLTIWQLRWGCYAALVLTLVLPWMLTAFRRTWMGWVACVVGLIPLGFEWKARLHPALDVREARDEKRAEQRASHTALRNLAMRMVSKEKAPFIAPWWSCPEIAYWSGQPGVGGSSHQSLGGNVDIARFYTTTDEKEAKALLDQRGVRWVVVQDEPLQESAANGDRRYPAVSSSAELLGGTESSEAMGAVLAESPGHAPAFLTWIRPEQLGLVMRLGGSEGMTLHAPQRHKLYAVDEPTLSEP